MSVREGAGLELGLRDLDKVALGKEIRAHFPIFSSAGDQPLAYLDTAASSQKPQVVIDRLQRYLSHEHANIHRGVYRLSAQGTLNYEEARAKVARFLNAPAPQSVVFTKGATESINLVAHSFEKYFEKGDAILLTMIEHHSNIVPWQLLAARKGLNLQFVDIHEDASLNLADFRAKLKKFTPKLLAVTQVSNAFGTVPPLDEICAEARAQNTRILIDAAQSVAHCSLDVQELGVDFAAFSGHKLYGPTGIGVLYIKPEHLDYLEPFLGGGDMIRSVTVEGSTWADPPQKFEAGTPPIAEAIALGTAVEFVETLGRDRIAAYEHELFQYAFETLRREEGVIVYGPALNGGNQESIVSFNLDGIHAHDIATVADKFNVQLRAGHHCAMPAMRRLNLQATARLSLGVYSTKDDLGQLLEAIRSARKIFR